MLSGYAKREWITIIVIGAMISITLLMTSLWWLSFFTTGFCVLVLAFFRDPNRSTPTHRGIMVSPCDGRVVSIHDVDHFEPFNESAVCIRIFMSISNVHINRSPCHGVVHSVDHKPGVHRCALNPESVEQNESVLALLVHPLNRKPLAGVRQIAGMIVRTIVCNVEPGDTLQRGQRYGMIKLGSTTELYIPLSLQPQLLVSEGNKVRATLTIIANVRQPRRDSQPEAEPVSQATNIATRATSLRP